MRIWNSLTKKGNDPTGGIGGDIGAISLLIFSRKNARFGKSSPVAMICLRAIYIFGYIFNIFKKYFRDY
ncbi:MAG: hypothetical protein B6244_12845 [Candidatus Cloacimonetes bacterium 4572_55]|nr:MAG: hypothetical protein B6244_12845 [Candidatus Cloacimonetes bacterium 4572_55]